MVLEEGGRERSVGAWDWGERDVKHVGTLLGLGLKPRSAGRVGLSLIIRIDLLLAVFQRRSFSLTLSRGLLFFLRRFLAMPRWADW
jgi:hypothetical protein